MIPDAELEQMKTDAERIQALREKATPGPWEMEYDNDTGPNDEGYWEFYRVGPATVHSSRGKLPQAEVNATLIAATRTDPSAANVLRLVGEVERLRIKLRDAGSQAGSRPAVTNTLVGFKSGVPA